MIIYRAIKNGQVISVWNSDFSDENYYEDRFGQSGEWTVEQEDFTEKIEIGQLVQESLGLQDRAKLIIANIYAINKRKNISIEQFNAILDDPLLQKIERLISQGSLSSAAYYIDDVEDQFYSENERAFIKSLLLEGS